MLHVNELEFAIKRDLHGRLRSLGNQYNVGSFCDTANFEEFLFDYKCEGDRDSDQQDWMESCSNYTKGQLCQCDQDCSSTPIVSHFS